MNTPEIEKQAQELALKLAVYVCCPPSGMEMATGVFQDYIQSQTVSLLNLTQLLADQVKCRELENKLEVEIHNVHTLRAELALAEKCVEDLRNLSAECTCDDLPFESHYAYCNRNKVFTSLTAYDNFKAQQK